MDMVTVPKRVVDLLAQVQKYGAIARASELQEVYRLIVAHSAGAQEPVAEVESWTNGSYHRNYKLRWLKDVEAGAKLYTHPQPMPQTDAAREVLLRAKRMLEGYADSYKRMGQDSTSRGGDGRITCIAVMYDIRDNMIGWIDAEIERIDCAKGSDET